ncbi:MAG TPA: hypothetical protein VKU01_26420 [Bryobacteraceae bacterium]|nr:hypothetical protein [Bryobacteraceae bacterium]
MLRWFFLVCAAIALAVSASAATIRLYLKDGTYQLAREYEVQSDRVHYFSTERGEWEDIPLELVDIKKTEAEAKQREDELKSEVKAQDEEDKAERAARKEAASVPTEAGAYYVNGTTLQPIKVAEAKVVNNKRRQVLKVLSPLPMVTGKSTLELDALHAPLVIAKPDPEFYIRLSEDERFGIIKMSEHQGHRVAEKITLVPVTNEVIEEPELVPVYRKQTADGVYKIWPQKPLEPGEYAVVEYTETKINMQIWDFAISGSARH